MSRIALFGYFGWGNFGDQLFLDTVSRRHADLFPEATGLMSLTRQHLGLHARLPIIGSALRAIYTLRACLRADTIAYCGGSVFSEVRGSSRLAELFGRSRQALGVSVGPFASARASADVRYLLEGFDRVIFRDNSWNLLERSNPVCGGDLAALSPLLHAPDKRAGIVICPSAAANSDTEDLFRLTCHALDLLPPADRLHGVTVLALNCHPRLGDESLCEALASRLGLIGIETQAASFRSLGLQRTCEAIASASLVISERLHGAIVSYLTGGRFVLVNHHPKCRDFVIEVTGADTLSPMPGEDGIASVSAALETGPAYRLSPEQYIARANQVYTGSD